MEEEFNERGGPKGQRGRPPPPAPSSRPHHLDARVEPPAGVARLRLKGGRGEGGGEQGMFLTTTQGDSTFAVLH